MTQLDFIHDIPADLARAAHRGTSHVPERRGEQEIESYANQLIADFEWLSSFATTDEKRATLEVEFRRYRAGYRRRTLAMLGAKSACVSTMITGGSNFNVRRARKRSDSANKRTDDLLEYRERALAAIRKALTPELQPIKSSDANAVERLESKVEKLIAKRDLMKAANKAIRKHAKAGADAQVAALVALGHPESVARELLKPDFAGRIGFPDYMITNLSAEIRRASKRAEVVQETQAQPDTVLEGEHARLEDSPADNRVRLFFPGKPARETIERLKRSGFRWSPSTGAWQAYRGAMHAAREIAGVAA